MAVNVVTHSPLFFLSVVLGSLKALLFDGVLNGLFEDVQTQVDILLARNQRRNETNSFMSTDV